VYRKFSYRSSQPFAIYACHADSSWNCVVVSGAARVQVPAFEIFVPGASGRLWPQSWIQERLSHFERTVSHYFSSLSSQICEKVRLSSLRCKTSAGRAGMPGARHASAGLSGLDLQREHELLALVVSGLLNKQIAAKLGTTEGAVSHSC
jgi:hypothetical protein